MSVGRSCPVLVTSEVCGTGAAWKHCTVPKEKTVTFAEKHLAEKAVYGPQHLSLCPCFFYTLLNHNKCCCYVKPPMCQLADLSGLEIRPEPGSFPESFALLLLTAALCFPNNSYFLYFPSTPRHCYLSHREVFNSFLLKGWLKCSSSWSKKKYIC